MDNYTLTIFTKEASGGTGTFLQILSGLGEEYRVRYVFLKQDTYKNTSIEGETLVSSYEKNDAPSVQKIGILIQLFIKVFRKIKNDTSDIFIASDPYSIVLLGLLKPLLRHTIFTAVHHIDIGAYFSGKPNILYRSLLKVLFRFAVRQFNFHIYVSTDLMKALNKRYGLPTEKTTVIFNGIRKRTAVRNNTAPSKTNPRLITVGRLNKQKDYETILKAFSLVNKKIPEAQLTIVSDGDSKNELVKKIAKLNIKNKIDMTGWVTTIDDRLAESDIFLFASHYEGFGITIIEAMAAGVPVIATDTPYGPGELTGKGRYGIIVPMGDAEAMANKVLELLKDSHLWKRYRQSGLDRAEKFTIEPMIESYRKVFAQVIRRGVL